MKSDNRPHIPVLKEEVVAYFSDCLMPLFVDGTVGAGGHASAILEAHPEIETYFALDRDEEALAVARRTLSPWGDKVVFIHCNFADLREELKERKVDEVNGFFLILASLPCNWIRREEDLVF